MLYNYVVFDLYLFICRGVQYLPVAVHLPLWSTMERLMCLARYYPSAFKSFGQGNAILPPSSIQRRCYLLISCSYLQQANNAYIFPGFGLGVVISGAIRVHEDMLLAACK